MKNIFSITLLLVFASCTHQVIENKSDSVSPGGTKSESLYQLNGIWQTQNDQPFVLTQLQGKKQVVAMIFTHCGYACPRIVDDMISIQKKIDEKKKNEVGFLLVSFDTERDNPKQLTSFATEHKLNDQWVLLHGDEDLVRQFSMLLGVNFQRNEDGNFSHSNIITLLDKNGKILKQQEGLEGDGSEILKLINGN